MKTNPASHLLHRTNWLCAKLMNDIITGYDSVFPFLFNQICIYFYIFLLMGGGYKYATQTQTFSKAICIVLLAATQKWKMI